MKSATIQAVLADAELTAGAQLVLFAIFSHADRDGVCYPSNATLLRHLKGMPEATLNRHLATLERLGRISRDYERQTRKRYITITLSRYTEGAAPITSDRCKSDLHLSNGRSAPIKQAGCTYQTEGSAPITSDRPNKNGSENGPENGPTNGARVVPIGDDEPFLPPASDPVLTPPASDPVLTPPAPARPADDPRTVAAAKLVDDLGVDPMWVYGHGKMFDPGWLRPAIEAAHAAGKLNPSYVLGILRRYDRQGGPDAGKGGYEPAPAKPAPPVEFYTPTDFTPRVWKRRPVA